MNQMSQLVVVTLASFIICLAVGMAVIPLLRRVKLGQQVRDDGPQTHLVKQGTPTMGGVMMLAAICIASLIMGNMEAGLLIPGLVLIFGFGLIGFLDDFIKTVRKRSLGLRAYQKILGQFGLALAMAVFAYNSHDIGSTVFIPFMNQYVDFGIWYIPFTVFVVLALTNATNLTDGLDGLASGVVTVICAAFAIICMFIANKLKLDGKLLEYGNYINLMTLAGAISGASLGFMRFNSFPAKVFMGDTGSLALGGAVVYLGIASRLMLLLPLMCGMMVANTVSVILQVGSYKLRHGKRVFKMAPLHHHFELLGWHETTVVAMYVIFTIVLCLMTLLLVN